jgi:hypothetical protein
MTVLMIVTCVMAPMITGCSSDKPAKPTADALNSLKGDEALHAKEAMEHRAAMGAAAMAQHQGSGGGTANSH